MRIGFHAPFLPALGGGEKVVLTLLADAVRRGHDVTLLSPGEASPDPAAWRRLLVDVSPGDFAWAAGGEPEMVTPASAGLDLLVALTVDVPPRTRAARSVAIVQFPWRVRTGLRGVLSPRARRHLRGYDRFLAYSRWVADHVRARLGVEASVLAPPVHGPAGPPVPKAPSIVAVGRFFRGAHDKRHDVLIDAYRDLAPPEPWTLHLVGGVLPSDRPHLEALRERARGARIELHPDASPEHLTELQAQAALAWHAAGFGADARRHPERLEHFGIAVAEAMAHGAVPLAFGAGGPAEIVDDGRDGRLWHEPSELVALSRALLEDDRERERLSEAARASARRFSPEAFLDRARTLVFDER
jgi:glycosyltransferase involved in cell wall biosynthesis